MSLAAMQDAIAELLCDARSLGTYTRERALWLALRDLTERERRILAELDAPSLRMFHEIHARDRAYFVEAVLPLTIARLGDAWSEAYFRERPYGADDTRIEAQRFVAYLEEDGEIGARDLARHELASFLLLDEPVFEPAPGNILRDPAAASLCPGIAVVPVETDVPALVEDPRATRSPAQGAILLRRDADGITPAWLTGPTARMLVAISRRDAPAVRALLATHEGQDAYLDILAQGVLL